MTSNHNDLAVLDDELPIKINVSDELSQYLPESFKRIKSTCNKLSAQLNFQTMTANWYNDERKIITITLELTSPKTYQHLLNQQKKSTIKVFSDDVFLINNNNDKPIYSVFVALTTKEQTLINTHPALSYPLIDKKFTKVINLLADYLAINKINV